MIRTKSASLVLLALVLSPVQAQGQQCTGRLQQFTVIWTGGDITISGQTDDAPGGLVTTNQAVTFFGPFDQNDVAVDISGSVNGESEFHISCSDPDFNDPSDCGKLAGNGKANQAFLINDWQFEGLIDKSGDFLVTCTIKTDNIFTDGFEE
jgi:hypothetical protein